MSETKDHNEIALVIFPFENLTEGSGLEIFCRSFHIDLITELSRFRHFTVISHSEGGGASSLCADYTIKGSFHYNRDLLRVSAQLVNAKNNHVVWADRFEGPRESIFAIQEDLLHRVVSTLQQQLNSDLLAQMRRKAATSLTAYEHWLLGMEELKKGSIEADEKAREYFQRAMEIDPEYSLAYSGMSMTYFNEWSCQLWDRWEVCQKGAYEWAKKAIECDEQNYVAACVLGRIYLYEGKYEVAEHYLRRALRLNSNDTDHLIQIASCFVFLGYVREAEEIYNKVVSLNPLHTRAYNHIGAIIAFESGDFKKCIALGENARTPWVDFPAFLAAAYFHAGDFGKMQATWEIFLEDFRKKILRAETVDSTDALQWIINVNPYREKTNLIPFSEFISGSKVTFASRVYSKTAEENHPNFFLKETGRWQIAYDGKLVHLNEVKGFYDLARLLGTPEKQFHCLELVGGGLVGTGEPAFDEKAKRNYQKKISALLEETRRAEDDHDLQRAAELRHEYEEILDHLSVSLGIGRKARKLNDPIDKARSAVTWRIRNAIQKIHGAHPALGKHLSVSIKTGLFCSYSPEKALKWVVEARPVTDQQPRLTM